MANSLSRLDPAMALLYILAIILSFTACQDEQQSDATATYRFDKVGELRFPLGPRMPTTTTSLKALEINGESSLFFVNRNRNALVQIPVDRPQDTIVHRFAVEGPDGIGELRGVSKFSDQAVVLATTQLAFIVFEPATGALRKQWLPKDPIAGQTLKQPDLTSNVYQAYCRIGDRGYFQQSNFASMQNTSEMDPPFRPIAYYDPATEQFGLTSFEFPADYNADRPHRSNASLASDGTVLVYSLTADHRVHVYNPENEQTLVYSCKSRLLDEIPAEEYDDLAGLFTYFAVNGHYKGVIYDPYRELYYRLVVTPAGDDRSYIAERNDMYFRNPRRFSVIVMDRDFKLLDEFSLPPDTYVMKNIVVLPTGLAISRMHPAGLPSEDEFVMDIFQVKPN